MSIKYCVLDFSAEWYKGVLTDEELHNLEFPKPKEIKNTEPAPSRRKPSRPTTTKRTFGRDEEE